MNAWLKRQNGPDEIVRIVHDTENPNATLVYQIYTAFEIKPDCLGRILFDANGYWIYDGEHLMITEQEQLARFIQHHMEVLWNS
jgi:hypothetical protein